MEKKPVGGKIIAFLNTHSADLQCMYQYITSMNNGNNIFHFCTAKKAGNILAYNL